MAVLKIIKEHGVPVELELGDEVVRAGRSHVNDIRLEDAAASREHFELRLRDGNYYISDLGSRNGTVVNGVPLSQEMMLLPGDEIVVGRTRLVLAGGDQHDEGPPVWAESGTMMYEAEQLSRSYLAESEAAPGAARRAVYVLSDVAREFMAITEEVALLDRLAARMLEVFSADRCAVVYGGTDTSAVDVRAVAVANAGLSREVRISTTAARHVLEEKMALVITDVLADDRFRGQQSILHSNITSIVCAPLWHEESVFGLLYLDTTGRIGAFSREQLALLTTFANLAAIKIDNLRLVEASIASARMERELALAAEIQQMMLPQASFASPGFASIGFNRACYEVGGDYFDFMGIDDNGFAVTVADVSGKGASGALLMASVKSMLTALVDAGAPLVERVTRLNRYVKDNSTSNKFVTFFHAELDRAAGVIRYCNAGHNPPILRAGDGTTTLLEATGPVLGLLEVPYRQEERPFPPGSALVAFSDGITEAVDSDDEEYGDDRLVELVAGLAVDDPEAMRDAILGDVERFAGGFPQHDDVTLVIVKRTG